MSTPRLFVAVLFAALFVLSARPVTDPDFGWHLKTGEYIVTTQTIPRTDFFSFTYVGAPWVTHEWLVQVAMYLLYQAGGFGALVILFALLAAAAFGLVYLRCEGRPYVAAFVVLFAAVAAAPFWGARPQTASLLLTSAFLFVLDRYRRTNQWQVLVWLAPLMLVWANSHGSFALGAFLILVYLIGAGIEKRVRWNADNVPPPPRLLPLVLILVVCLALIAVNPNGLGLYPYPLQTLASSVIQTYIQEWQPPDLVSIAILPFALMLVLTMGALAAARRRLDFTTILLLIGFTLVSLRAARQISIWVLIAAPALASALVGWRDLLPAWVSFQPARPTPRQRVLNTVLLVLFAWLAVARLVSVIGEQAQAERRFFPVSAVDWLEQNKVQGPIYNQYEWGGYLIWRLYPRERVFIDGRSDLYSLNGDFVVREYLKAFTGSSDWQEPLERYQVRTVLVAPDAPIAARLRARPDWQARYQDAGAAIFTRK